jgi:hypothetical protein
VADSLSRIILDFASKNTRGYTLPDTLPSTILAPMLELIVEPYAPFAPFVSPDTLTSAFVEPSSLVQDRTNAGSDECVLTDLVASAATASSGGDTTTARKPRGRGRPLGSGNKKKSTTRRTESSISKNS